MEYLVGIDPSFSRTGLAKMYCDENNAVLSLIVVNKLDGADKGFVALFDRIEKYSGIVKNAIMPLKNSYHVFTIISEEPLPNSSFSAGLYALDTMIFHKLIESDRPNNFYTVNPSYLKFLHHTVHNTKKESKALADAILKAFIDSGVTLTEDMYNKKGLLKNIPHDACEAFLFLCKALVTRKLLAPNGLYYYEILERIEPRFLEPREHILLECL